jgi:hypothetical protein
MRRTRLIATIAGLAIAAGLTACSGSSSAGEAVPTTPEATTVAGPAASAGPAGTASEPGTASFVDPLTPESPPAPGKLAPLKRLGRPADGESGVAWRLERYQPEAGQLVLTWATGSNGSTCLLDKGIRVVETSTTVTVAAIGWIPPNVRIACTGERVVHTGYLDLASPLGGRQLIHAPVLAGWTTVPELPALP